MKPLVDRKQKEILLNLKNKNIIMPAINEIFKTKVGSDILHNNSVRLFMRELKDEFGTIPPHKEIVRFMRSKSGEFLKVKGRFYNALAKEKKEKYKTENSNHQQQLIITLNAENQAIKQRLEAIEDRLQRLEFKLGY